MHLDQQLFSNRNILILLCLITAALLTYQLFPSDTISEKRSPLNETSPVAKRTVRGDDRPARDKTSGDAPASMLNTRRSSFLESDGTASRMNDILLLRREIETAIEKKNSALLELLLRSLAARGAEAVPLLLELLQQHPQSHRFEYYLHELQDASMFPLFRHVYETSPHELVQRTMLRLMADNTNPEVVAFLEDLLEQSLPDSMTGMIIYALSTHKDQHAATVLLNLLDEPQAEESTWKIIDALIQTGDPRVKDTMFDLIRTSSNRQTLALALRGLSQTGDKTTVSQLISLLPVLKQHQLQHVLYGTIGELLGNKGITILMSLTDSDQAAELNHLGPQEILFLDETEIFDQVTRLLKTHQISDNFMLSQLVEYYRDSGKEEAGPLLRELYARRNTHLNRLDLIEAIGSIPSPDSVQFLESLLAQQNPEYIRWAAIEALQQNFGEQAFSALIREIQTGTPLAMAAYDAVAEIGGPGTRTILDSYQKGISISNIIPDSQAARIGLQPGDIIRSYNHQETTHAPELQQLVSSTSLLEPVEIEIERQGQMMTYVINGGSIGIYLQEILESCQ
ncbi:PDZ domain-containing protein [bacterium]|nr:PDZ domain-containing protein [bacterium]